MHLLQNLNWRYATKEFNQQTVPQAKVNLILEAARLAPSSNGLQPYHLFLIPRGALLDQLANMTYGNKQLRTCSHLIVFSAWDNYTPERINEYFSRQNQERELDDSLTNSTRLRIIAQMGAMSALENFHHATKQSFLAAMCAMIAASECNVDCTPMEGFEADKVDALLKLPEQGLRSTLLLPIGYRDEETDWLHGMKKVRRHMDDFVTVLD